MNRRDFERHLRTHECQLHRHGGGHDIWINPRNKRKAPLPRHSTIKRNIVRSVCKKLDVPLPDGL